MEAGCKGENAVFFFLLLPLPLLLPSFLPDNHPVGPILYSPQSSSNSIFQDGTQTLCKENTKHLMVKKYACIAGYLSRGFYVDHHYVLVSGRDPEDKVVVQQDKLTEK